MAVFRAGTPIASARVEHEDGIARGKIADRTRHRLRINTILAARKVALFVQHLVPRLAPLRDAIEEFAVAFRACRTPLTPRTSRRAIAAGIKRSP
jgi:hypothetical protein